MNSDAPRPHLGTVPKTYDPTYFARLVREIEQSFQQTLSPGHVRAYRVNISSLPTSATGLRVGDLWNDSGTVKVVT